MSLPNNTYDEETKLKDGVVEVNAVGKDEAEDVKIDVHTQICKNGPPYVAK